MTTIERLQSALTGLGLKAVEARLEGLLEQAAKTNQATPSSSINCWAVKWTLAERATCEPVCNWHTCRFSRPSSSSTLRFQPSIDERQIRELRTLRFVHEASNVILLGPPGVGKTHLSVALGRSCHPGRIWRLLHDGARSGHRSRTGVSRRASGSAHASLPGAQGSDHRRNGLSAARRPRRDDLLPTRQRPL